MTWRIFLLGLALAGLGWTLLNLRMAPVGVSWKLGLIAGELGHALAVLMAVVALLAASALVSGEGTARGLAGMAFVAAVVALALGMRPAVLAARLGRDLPEELAKAFGEGARAAADEPAAFAWARLGRVGGAAPVRVETREFADALAMDVYHPPGRDTPRPAIIVIHGGGWDGGDRAQLAGVNHHLARLGYVVVAISYRLAPEHVWPAQRDDVRAAIACVKTHAGELGIDATRLVLFGRSAGGQLATAVGYGDGDPAVRGVVAWYAPHDLNFAWRHARADDALNSEKLMRQYLGGPGDVRRAAYDEASGIRQVRRRVADDPRPTPPTLLIHGTIDTLVWRRQSERLATVLAVNEVPHVFLELPWGVHAFDFWLHGPGGQLADYALQGFLRAVMIEPAAGIPPAAVE